MSKSNVTDGSPASILATRDWLDLTRRANPCWVRRLRCLRAFKLFASLTLSSTYAASFGESPRNSAAVPKRQPFDSRRFLFDSRIVITPKPTFTRLYSLRCGPRCLLVENLHDNDRIWVDSVHNSPGHTCIVDPQLVTTRTDQGAWASRAAGATCLPAGAFAGDTPPQAAPV